MKGFLNLLKSSTRTAKFGLVIIAVWVLCAVLAPVLSPGGPNDINIMQRFKPPVWMDGGSAKHLLGTDEMGRDVLSRLIYGCQISLVVGFMSVAVSLVLGTALGPLAGYLRGFVDTVIMRGVDVMLSFSVHLPRAVLHGGAGIGARERDPRIGHHRLGALYAHGPRADAVASRARVRSCERRGPAAARRRASSSSTFCPT